MDTNAVTYDRPARAGDYGYAMSNDDFDSYRYSAFVTRVLPDGDLMVDLHGAGRRWQLNPKGFTIDRPHFGVVPVPTNLNTKRSWRRLSSGWQRVRVC